MVLAIDIHDTLTAYPKEIKALVDSWVDGDVYFITGTPESQKDKVKPLLKELRFVEGVDYEQVLYGFEYDPDNLSDDHFQRMAEHKLEHLKKIKATFYIDDNPYYVSFVRNHGICTLQCVLPDEYINNYGDKTVMETFHFQREQWRFINQKS